MSRKPVDPAFEREWGMYQISQIGMEPPATSDELREIALQFWEAAQRAQTDAPFSMEAATERRGDMGEGTKLQVFREDDGDLIVSVMPQKHRFAMDEQRVQFCTPGSGGGHSPRTWQALLALWKAMALDAAERPES